MSAVVVGRRGAVIPVAELEPIIAGTMRRLDEIVAEQADADAHEPIVEAA